MGWDRMGWRRGGRCFASTTDLFDSTERGREATEGGRRATDPLALLVC